MTRCGGYLLLIVLAVPAPSFADDRDVERDLLVTFENRATGSVSSGFGAPYRNRKRYTIAAEARRNAEAVATDYTLVEIDNWPIRSLSVYCVVYRIADAKDRDVVIDRLSADARVESVQPLQEFETGTDRMAEYDDTYANLQHGLATMSVPAAHRRSLGEGVRIVIIDSEADARHEDLRGRLRRLERFSGDEKTADADHGTAIASVIGANANNSKGIVGIAPRARIDVFAACWAEPGSDGAVCDSFSLAKALDSVIADPPDIVNMSLTGPHDALLGRLLEHLHSIGVVIVSAVATDLEADNRFPSSLDGVIGVASSDDGPVKASAFESDLYDGYGLYAPGQQILVAVPDDAYDFRSGSSIAAAHVSGVAALILARAPDLTPDDVVDLLRRSQVSNVAEAHSVNACLALQLIDDWLQCGGSNGRESSR